MSLTTMREEAPMIKISKRGSISDEKILARRDASADVSREVAAIIANVRRSGDEVLREYGQRFDGVLLSSFEVSEGEIDRATDAVGEDFLAVLREAAENMERNAARMAEKRDRLIKGLKAIPHSALNGDAQHRLPGNVNFCFEGIEGESLLLLLDDKGIEASSGSACTSGSLDPSHVLLAIGRVHDVAHGSLRLSIGEDLSDEDTEYIIRSVAEVVEYLRSFSPIWRDLESGKKPHIL